jgi:hypothetical protein
MLWSQLVTAVAMLVSGGQPIHPHDLRCRDFLDDPAQIVTVCTGGTNTRLLCEQTATQANCLQTSAVYGDIAYTCAVQLGLFSTWRCREIGGDQAWTWNF